MRLNRHFAGNLPSMAFAVFFLVSCAIVEQPPIGEAERLQKTAVLVAEVKIFGETLGIKPTNALAQTTSEGKALSMLWFWLQRMGTLALHAPIDVRLAVGFSTARERLALERVYRVDGYSVYYRQGNEFADDSAVTTQGFANEALVRRVQVILHEDLHGDENFALPWEIEEALVTPLGSLAAVAFFASKGDGENLQRARTSVAEERRLGRELLSLAQHAEQIFAVGPLEEGRARVLRLMADYPTYERYFRRQLDGQNPMTVLEAKLSHDLAYFRYFDAVVALSEKAPNLITLITDLKGLPPSTGAAGVDSYLGGLDRQYSALPR